MKAALLMLLALCGLAAGLHYPLSYEYEYRGEIKNGFKELRYQFAGAVITAKIRATLVSQSEINFQISEPRVGSKTVEVQSQGRAPLPIELQPPKDKAAIEQPFKLHFTGYREKLEVPSNDLLWISNLRKSVAKAFVVPYVLSKPADSVFDVLQNRFRSSDFELNRAFKKEEETIHGICNVMYTLTKATSKDSMVLEELAEDAQLKEAVYSHQLSARPLPYKLVRSVDLYDCKDRVVLKKATHGNATLAGVGQLRGLQSRSSVGEYLLYGNPTNELTMRIEKAIIESVVTLNPHGFDTHKIMTIANQTLTLIKTTTEPIVPQPQEPLKEEPFVFRVESPYHKGEKSPFWVSFQSQGDYTYPAFHEKELTGYKLTDRLLQRLKDEVQSQVHKMASLLEEQNKMLESPFGGSQDGAIVQKMVNVIQKVQALRSQELVQLYNELAKPPADVHYKNVRKLYIDALKASGSPAAIKLLFEKMKSKEISYLESAEILITLPVYMKSPANIPQLIEFAQDIDEDASFLLRSSAYTATSTIIRRMCLNKAVKEYSTYVEIMGENQCDIGKIRAEYIPHLKNKLTSAEKYSTKAIMIVALGNLGDKQAIEAIVPVAQGTMFPREKPLRMLAIQELSKNHLINTTFPLAQEVLLTIAEEQFENPIVREAALASLLTLPKNATIWQRLALQTWREPSPRVASFIYTSIKAMARSQNPHYINQINMARHVLSQAKPYPRTRFFSESFKTSMYDQLEDIAAVFELQYLNNGRWIYPEQLMIRLKEVLGGFKYPVFHFEASAFNLNALHSAITRLSGAEQQRQPTTHNSRYRRANEEYEQATSSHTSVETDQDKFAVLLHLTYAKHVQLYVPITADTLGDMHNPQKSLIGAVMEKVIKGETVQSVSYYSPIQVSFAFPSEIGLPIITKLSKPTILYMNVNGSLVTENAPLDTVWTLRNFNYTGEATTKVVTKFQSVVKVLVPWSNETVVSGLDTENTFSLKSKFSVGLFFGPLSHKMFQLSIKPQAQEEIPVVLRRNLPYTVVRKMLPSQDLSEERELKPVYVIGEQPYVKSKIQVPFEPTGLKAEIDFKGDREFPFNTTTIYRSIKYPLWLIKAWSGPTARYYQMVMVYKPAESDTKEIVATINYVVPPASSQSGSRLASVQQPPVLQSLSAEDTIQQRIHKLQSSVPVKYMLSASINFTDYRTHPRQFEAALIKFIPQYSRQVISTTHVERAQAQYQLNFMRSRLRSEAYQQPRQVCLVSSVEYPKLPLQAQVSEVLKQQIDTEVYGQMYHGEECNTQNKDYTLSAKLFVSNERRQYLESHMQNVETSYPPLDTTEAVKSALVYDRFEAEIKREKAPSDKIRNVTNHMCDFFNGAFYSFVSCNRINVEGPRGVVSVKGYRSLVTDKLEAWTHTEESICHLRGMPVPPHFDVMMPLNGQYNFTDFVTNSQHMQLEATPSRQCVIEPSRVTTFAGVQYSKKPVPCGVLAVKTKSEQDRERFLILTEEKQESPSAEQEIKIVYPEAALTFIVKKQEILLNGQRVSESQKEIRSQQSNQIVAKISQTPSVKIIEVPNKFKVELKQGSQVVIQMNPRYKSELVGICGRFTDEQQDDLKDSKQCLYKPSRGQEYAAAWIASSELQRCKQSSSAEFRAIISQTERYQQNCPRTLQELAAQRERRRA